MKNQHFKIKVPVVVRQNIENNRWIAYCPILKTYGYSNLSEEDAFSDFDDAIETFFYVQNQLGTLNRTLLNFGWTRKEKELKFEIPSIHSDLPPFRLKSGQTSREINLPEFA
jgi:hypothetical protein